MNKDEVIECLKSDLINIDNIYKQEIQHLKENFSSMSEVFKLLLNLTKCAEVYENFLTYALIFTASARGVIYEYKTNGFTMCADKKFVLSNKKFKAYESAYLEYFTNDRTTLKIDNLDNCKDHSFENIKHSINYSDISNLLGKSSIFLPFFSFKKELKGLVVLSKGAPFNNYEIDNLELLVTGLVSALEKINHIETKEKLLRLENAVLKQNYYSSLGHLAAGVAHFVKNSLFNIKGRAGILMKNKNKNEKEYELLETIYRRSLDTERVVNDLLRFAKRDNSTSENSRFDLKSLISSVVDLFNEEFRLKAINLTKEFCHDTILLSGNEFALKECFINLLKNAIEAIPQSGNITIAVTEIQNNIVISLANNGVKIDDADQKKIFDPFFTTKANSSGIGLFETRKTIDEHGGSIELTESNDRQTVFTIKLPKFLKQD